MKIVVAGGTGFIGRRLIGRLLLEGHELTALTRSSRAAVHLLPHGVHPVSWDGRTQGGWTQAVDGADVVVNLAGESIAGRRWSAGHAGAAADPQDNWRLNRRWDLRAENTP